MNLWVGGAELRFRGATEPHADHFRALGPFCEPAPADLHVDITLGEPPVTGDGFVFRRDHFHVCVDPVARTAHAWTEGSPEALEAVIDVTLQAVLLRVGGCLVHAAAGAMDGVGWLLPGRSGAGKSTSARGGFDEVLSDERVVLRRAEGGGFRVYGTPIWSTGRELPLRAGSVPLAVVARLVKAENVAVAPLEEAAALADLLGAIVLYEEGADARRMAFEVGCDVVAAVRCVELDFPKEDPWVTRANMAICAPNFGRQRPTTSRSGCTGTSRGAATTAASTATSRSAVRTS